LLITGTAIPSIVGVALLKGLNGKPNVRSSHTNETPLLGGVAVFAGLILSTVIIAGVGFVHELKYIIAGLIILFFIGVKDDILVIDPKKKLVAQIFASLIVIVLGDIRISTFHGMFGVDMLPYLLSIAFTLFVFIILINGFNLIDGIDGLASGIGIITSIAFGAWFWMAGYISYVVFCFSLAGSLIAFFRFNVFSKENKIFLGDTGALIIGLSMAVVTVRFLQYEGTTPGNHIVPATPAVAIGIMIVPLSDTLRVFLIRILKGYSPFKADRSHVHHRLLDLGMSHLQATLTIISVNLLFIGMVILLQDMNTELLLAIVGLLAIVVSSIPVFLLKRKARAMPIKYSIPTIVFQPEHMETQAEKKIL
jgi:UDP-GlcNAc:undecaprenyl-phosphate GlcNAc-1-phosphate transferase